jgi:putative oxidoreductase
MKYLSIVAGLLLGLLFVFSGVVVLFDLVEVPPIPEGTPPGHFMAAFGPTGYMTFIKVLEVLGGILVAIPRTRCLGLLVLGPIVVNILAFHLFVTRGQGLLTPMIIGMVICAAYLLWAERRAFAHLAVRRANT